MTESLKLHTISEVGKVIIIYIEQKIRCKKFVKMKRINGLNLLLKIALQNKCNEEIINYIKQKICNECHLCDTSCELLKEYDSLNYCSINDVNQLSKYEASIYKQQFQTLFSQLNTHKYGVEKCLL